MQIVLLILPVFAIILTGWFFKFFRLFKKDASSDLIQFVYYLAGPAILFFTFSEVPLKDIWNWLFLIIFGGVSLVLFLFLILFFRIRRYSMISSVLYSLCGCFSNAGFIGLPILFGLFGRSGLIPGALALIWVMILFAIGIFLLEVATHFDRGFSFVFGKAFFGLIKNPFLIATFLGVLFSLFEIRLEGGFRTYVNYFQSSLTPVALFAIGLQVDVKNFLYNFIDTFFITLIKLVFFPLIIFFLVWQFNLPHFWAISAVIAASLPAAKSVAIISVPYSEDVEVQKRVSEAIAATTLLSILTILGWLYLLSMIYPQEIQFLIQSS